MPEFLQFLFSGLTVGAIYALVALGFTLIYNASDVINFAQGEFVMLGGMVTFFAHAAGLPLPLAGGEPWVIGGAALLPQSVIVLIGAGAIVVALWAFMTMTLTGKALVATAANRLAARL